MLMKSLVASLVASLAAGYLVAPPGTAYPESSSDCSGWVAVTSGLTCVGVEEAYSITEADFEAWNTLITLTGTCSLVSGYDYCVQINFESSSSNSSSSIPAVTTSSSSTSTTSTTSVITTTTVTSTTTVSGNGITTPTPIQSGMVSDCNAFHLVASGDSCQIIATEAGISLADFYTWNPTVGSSCASLWLGYYVCTGIVGDSTTSSSPRSTQLSGTGIITPTPIQTGFVANCDVFYMVKSGDTCQAIASTSGISLSDFYAWNPAVGRGCTSLLAGDYVCVMITGFTVITSTTSATTTSGNGIPTPSPTQSGMVDDCDQFHLVVSGDSCASIASGAGISLANFYSWNPTVGTSCSSLWLGYYVCVDIIGYTSTATTLITTTSTTTTAGNGVATPTPIQPGMVTDCDKFYLVGTGASCSAIATQEGVTLAQIESWNSGVGSGCTDLWPGYYICVGIL